MVCVPEEIWAVEAQPRHARDYVHGAKGGYLKGEVFSMGSDTARIRGGGVCDVACKDRPAIDNSHREGMREILRGKGVELNQGGVEESVRRSDVNEGLQSYVWVGVTRNV